MPQHISPSVQSKYASLLKPFPCLILQLKILVVGGLGGRMDHELSNIHTLYCFPTLRIIIISNHSLLFLLPSGLRHVIRPNPDWEGPHCGLIPVGEPSKGTTTSGLKWNLGKTY